MTSILLRQNNCPISSPKTNKTIYQSSGEKIIRPQTPPGDNPDKLLKYKL